jgi:hypothetical protein
MVQPFDTVKGVQRRMSHVVEVWFGVVEAVATECRVRIVKAEKAIDVTSAAVSSLQVKPTKVVGNRP